MSSVLLVEDDRQLRRTLRASFRMWDFDVSEAASGEEALTHVSSSSPDLVVLDLTLPGIDGLETLRHLRTFSGAPVLVLTVRDSLKDKVAALESGADDYVVKPFKPKELVARMRARLRHHDDIASESLTIGPPEALVEIDVPAHQVQRDGRQIGLTPLEFDLLVALARKPRQVFTREVLLEQVWGYRHAADTRLVNVHVQRLRAKVERDPEKPEVVLTVRGVGYKAGPP